MDGRAADGTGCAGATIDLELHGKEAGLAFTISEVGNGGTAGPDGPGEDASAGLEEGRPVRQGKPAHRRLRVDPGGKEDFRGIDIADAGDEAAVQEEVFDGAPAVGALPGQPGRRQAPGPRFQPHLLEFGGRHPGGVEDELAEAAHILVDEPLTILAGQDKVDMGGQRAGRVQEEEASGHAQMHQQGLAVMQVDQEIFAPAGETGGRP